MSQPLFHVPDVVRASLEEGDRVRSDAYPWLGTVWHVHREATEQADTHQ